MRSIFNFFSSLRLTVATLALSLVLVFAGTIAQVKMGLYIAQEQFFSSLLIYWQPQGASWRIPVFPGGYLLGGILVVNLIAAHFKRFTFSKKKLGIFIIHAGLIVLFLGQFATQLFQVESYMAIPEGGSRNYSEAQRNNELAIIDVTDPKVDKVVSFPEQILVRNIGGEIRYPEFPFAIKVQEFHQNTLPRMEKGTIHLDKKPPATAMDDRDIPSAKIAIVADGATKGEWLLSNWFSEEPLANIVRKNFGDELVRSVAGPQAFEVKGRKYLAVVRAQRFYKPFRIALQDFKFDRYLGTGVAKNYSSRVRIDRPDTGENRELTISMNSPLRYGGETYYQQSFFENEKGTILQVVRNPSWLTPYVACIMVSVGLLVQFLGHLIGFARKRTATT